LILPMSSFSQNEDDGGIENLATIDFDTYFEMSRSKEEILLLTKTLLQYKISFSDLVRLTPKHKDTKKLVFTIVHIILQDIAFLDFLLQHKKLPISLLCKQISISRITIERHRKYIIAMTILLSGPYENLQKYVKEVHNL
jgi:RNA polymerase sigma factor